MMNNQVRNRWLWSLIVGLTVASLACVVGGQGTAIPAGRPASFEVQTATPTLDPDQISSSLEPVEGAPIIIVPLNDVPTHTPDPNRPPTPIPQVIDTPTVVPTVVPEVEPTPTPEPPTPEATVVVSLPPDPPLEGGDWDFESDYIPWPNPYGEPCPGAAVASGWNVFVERGEYGSSCLNENLYAPNVFSGLKSQEITFDFIASNSGVFRTIPTKVGHQYRIAAYAKHDHSLVPVEMFLGVDRTGGTTWNAESVEWFPWASSAEDAWVPSEAIVTATSEQMTIFIRGYHPVAEQGGKTVIDNVSVTDLGS
jgi:hypothetical protein